MINVLITHIGQSLDLKRKEFDNTLKLRLPNGATIDATVNAQAVEVLMKLVAGTSGEEPDEPAPSGSADDEFTNALYEGEEARVFGGTPEDDQQDDGQLPLPIHPPQEVTPAKPKRNGKRPSPQPIRIKTVPKDEAGYPIVAGGVPAASGVAAPELDDDEGVAQI